MKIFNSIVDKLTSLTSFSPDNNILLKVFSYAPKILIGGLTFSLIASVLDGAGLGLLLSFLQSLINPDNQEMKTGVNFIDVWVLGIYQPFSGRLFLLSGLILLMTWLRSWFLYLQSLFTGKLELIFISSLRKRIFEQLQSLSLSYFFQTKTGELINSLTTEINKIRITINLSINLVSGGIKLSVYGLVIWLISWRLSLISMVCLSLLSLGLSTLRKYVQSLSIPVSKANGEFTSVVMELITGIFTVQAFATQEIERDRFSLASEEITETETRSIVKASAIDPLGIASGTTLMIALIVLGITYFKMSLAGLLTFIYALRILVQIVQDMNKTATEISIFHGSWENINELLKPDNKPYFQNGYKQFPGLRESIVFRCVDFSYGDEAKVLHNINLEIIKGQVVAVVGASGAGKTTLAALIPRFYEPQSGQILLDSQDVRDFDITSLRQKIAVVSQDTFIFNASVIYNIAYGSKNPDQAKILQAAKLANAMEFIEELPQGFETLLGDRGVRLSGGQRQRVAIARAILRNPEILILDEATSALDSVSERLIQEALEALAVNRTVIAIAHRLSTIAKASLVVVLEEGKIVEQGTYQELLELQGKLWHYHQLQHNLD